jgi:nucleotide-binding universal stress UspA family protein
MLQHKLAKSALRTIAAVLSSEAATKPALAGFRALPVAENVKLIGLHLVPVAVNYGLIGDIALASFIEAQVEAAKAEREAVRASFSAACEQAGIHYEWRAAQSFDTLVSPQAGSLVRAADIVLCPSMPEQGSIGRHRLEEVVFAAGRPVIGLPSQWNGPLLGGRVLIAWDGGREAARATFDAIPLLHQAEEVRLVSVNGFEYEPVRQFTPADDIAAALSRHGIRVEAHSFESTRRSVADELQAQALDFGADLLVMGCYGHARMRERILGGVSREMLRELPLPVLLAN